MAWTGAFAFGRGWAVFRGEAADNSAHAHVTVQVTLAPGACITGSDGVLVRGDALVVRSGAPHVLSPAPRVTLLHLEPQTAKARLVLDAIGPGAVEVLPDRIAALIDLHSAPETMIRALATAAGPDPELDPRLAAALAFLADTPDAGAVAGAARAAELSVSRLRALAQAELGVSLATWLMWRKLERSGRALAAGAPLAEAALDGGFVDQAHYSRAMRKAFGVTPRTAGSLVRQAKGARPGQPG